MGDLALTIALLVWAGFCGYDMWQKQGRESLHGCSAEGEYQFVVVSQS